LVDQGATQQGGRDVSPQPNTALKLPTPHGVRGQRPGMRPSRTMIRRRRAEPYITPQNRLDPRTSASAADQRAMPIHSLRFCCVPYGPARLQHTSGKNRVVCRAQCVRRKRGRWLAGAARVPW
jgi:hypothetical protein